MRDVFGTVLRYKLWFDLWGARQRTLQAVLTIAIGAFAVGTIMGTLWGVQADTKQTWATVSAPTILLRLNPPAPDDLLDSLRNRPDLAAVDGQLEQMISWRRSPDAPWEAAILIARDRYEDQQLNLLLIDEGEWPTGRAVALERRFGLAPGEQVQLKIADCLVEAPVVGTLYNRAGASASLGGSLMVYTTRERFAELTGQAGFTTLLAAVPEYSPEQALTISQNLQRHLAEQGFTSLPAAFDLAPVVNPQQAWFEELIAGIGLVMQVVGVITMALSLLLIYTTVMAIMTQQTAQIGELKAIGASSSQIMWVYLLLVSAYGVLAALVSMPLAVLLMNALRFMLVARFGMDAGPFRVDWPPLLLQGALCVLAPVLIALFPIFRGARITVREAISSYGLSSTGNALDALLARAFWLSRVLSMAISNAFRSGARLFLTQLALGGAGVTLVAVMSTHATLRYTSGDLMRQIYPYQLQLDSKQPATAAQLNAVLDLPEVQNVELWQSLSATMELSDGRSRALRLSGVPIPAAAYRPQLYAGRWLAPDDGYAIVLVESLANQLGVQLGDWVTIKIPSADPQTIWASQQQWQVVGIAFEPYLRNLSRFAFVPGDTLMHEAQLGQKFTRVHLQVPSADSPEAARIANQIRSFYEQRGVDMAITTEDTVYGRSLREANNLNVISLLLMVIAVIMAAVGGVALSGVQQISVLERRREIGVLRAIGATPQVVRSLFVIEGLILGWLSCLVALLFSYPVGWAISRMLADTLGISIVFQYAWWSVLAWLVLASLIGVFASLAPAQQAITASVQESLAYE